MQMTMTERDKKLLAFLACILILTGFGWYTIRPMYHKIVALDDEISVAQMKKDDMDMKIVSLPMLQQRSKELKTQVQASAADYYDLMTSQEVDKELTAIVISHGLGSVNLDISSMDLSATEAYSRSALAREQEISEQLVEISQENETETEATSQSDTLSAAETYAQETSDAEVDSQDTEQVQDQIYSYQVQMLVEGTEREYEQIIDLFANQYPAIRLTGFSYIKAQPKMVLQEDGSLQETEASRQLQLELELYMCNKSV